MKRLLSVLLVVLFFLLCSALGGDLGERTEYGVERGMQIDGIQHRERCGLWRVGLTNTTRCTFGVDGDEPRDSEGSLREELSRQSPFVEGPQLTITSLRNENLELKAVIARLASRVETLERRLSRMERGDARFVSDLQLPASSDVHLEVPDQIERGMQIDALQHGMMRHPLGGTLILGF
jgi:hypothetical protein